MSGQCPTCGPTTVEQHPRQPAVTRCGNCKEWLTSVPPTQPPAAPETDVRLTDLFDRAHDEVIRLCQPGESWRMSIPANPDRDSDLILSDALTKAAELAERVRVVEGERKEWKSRAFDAVARAESAEAAHRALREDIEALADEAKARKAAYPDHPHWAAWDHYESDLRALLAGGAR